MAGDLDAPVHITHRVGDPRNGELTVRVGTEIHLTLEGTPAYGWEPITVVTGAALRVMLSESANEGTVYASLRALEVGEAELRSTSSVLRLRQDDHSPPGQPTSRAGVDVCALWIASSLGRIHRRGRITGSERGYSHAVGNRPQDLVEGMGEHRGGVRPRSAA